MALTNQQRVGKALDVLREGEHSVGDPVLAQALSNSAKAVTPTAR